jgi:hypothetical protein
MIVMLGVGGRLTADIAEESPPSLWTGISFTR